MALDFNIEPFYDDYSEDKKFYRILFRPGYAVQARELTQLQTIIQQQVKRQGDHLFKNGAMVIPGQIGYDTNTPYITLESNLSASDVSTSTVLSNITGKTYRGQTSGVEAVILVAVAATAASAEPDTLFVKYIKGSTDDVESTGRFIAGEILSPIDETLGEDLVVADEGGDEMGIGTTATIERGVYYIKDNFVLVDQQTVVVSKYSSVPSAKIGLKVVEEIRYPEDDESLLDNALGSPNYAAPGAARYYIDLVLSSLPLSTEVDPYEFIPLLTLENGEVQFLVNKTEYAQLEKTLARRTFDESGDYSVRPFPIQIKEKRNNYRGVWAFGQAYIKGDIVLVDNTTTYKCITDHISATSGSFSSGANWLEDSSPRVNFGKELGPNTISGANALTSEMSLAIEPGKAYVRGYEIEKVATQYLTLNKSRAYPATKESISVDTSPGNYIIIDTVNSLPDITTFTVLDLYDRYSTAGTNTGTKVGTAKAYQIQYHDTVSSTPRYKLFLFDIQMIGVYNFARDAKWIYSATGGSAATRFSAKIAQDLTELNGLISTAVFSSPSTTITSTDSTYTADLKIGDYVNIAGTAWRVNAIPSSVSFVVDGDASTYNGSRNKVFRIGTLINNPTRLSPIFALPRYAVKSTANLEYQFYKSAIVSGSSIGQAQVNTGYTYESASDDRNYIMVNNATGAHLKLSSGSTGSPAAGFFEVSGAGTDTATFIVRPADVGSYTVIYCLKRSSTSPSVQRNKALVVRTQTLTLSSGKQTLDRTDIFELVSVTAAGVDVIDKFTFDNGQLNSHYAFGSISTTESSLQSSEVVVKYQYFSHATSGDYFAVDSYTHVLSGIEFEEVSRLQSGCIDFRPSEIPNAPFWTTPIIPKYGELTTITYDYYYGRIDKLSIDYTGSYILTEGTPAADPEIPKSPDNAMDLFVFNIEPYTYSANYGVQIKKVENKRYTMRDINKIENRVKNLEYYASLSNLEQNTSNLKSYDGYGLERPQNGFLVDGFNGQGVGNAASLDWKASIDTVNNELRPFVIQNQINLLENLDSGITRSNKGYEVNGDIVTLKIQEKIPFVSQLRASHIESVNPFDLYTYKGDLEIIPWSDTWFETQRRPDIIINDNSQYDAVVAKAERDGVLGTIFGAWQTVWSGVTESSTDSFSADRRSGDGGRALDATFGNVAGGGGWAIRTVTVASSTTTTVQARTNIVTSIASRTDYTTISDKIVATDIIPFMRSRKVVFRGAAFKPKTRLYPFFDDIDVSAYVKPSKCVVVYPKTIGAAMTEFVINSNVGTSINDTARKINDVVATAYSYGEVLREYTNAGVATNKTMVVVGQETTVVNGSVQYLLYVENIKFSAGPNAGTETTPSVGTTHYWEGEFNPNKHVRFDNTSTLNSSGLGSGTASTTILNSSFTGQVFGTFDIPNNNGIKFRTGTRLFRFTDSKSNTRKDELTSGEAYFESRGILQTYEKTVLATKTAKVVSEQVTENRSLISSSDRVLSDTGWYDPLAQTFLVDIPGGVFLTDVDLFFGQKPSNKDPEVPVRIEIRNVVNGYPGPVIVPYSRVSLQPSKVNVDVSKGTAVTNFKFVSPLFLQSGVEYCLCIFSDSSKYKVWVSEAGQIDVNGSGIISTQPYAGVLFKSQNASTWTADQSQDLKFRLNRAKFTVGSAVATSATLNLVNQHVTSNIPYDVAQIDINNIAMSDTSISTAFKANVNEIYQTVQLGNSILFDTSKTVSNSVTENGVPSMYAQVTLSTDKENISPIIDLSRCSATLIRNVIENSTSVDDDFENLDSAGAATAKYVTKAITLNDPASTIRILYNANIPNAAKVDVYYKVGDNGSNSFDGAEYKLITNGGPNVSTFKEVIKSENRRQFGEAEYLVENLTPFTTLKIKLVMKSSNSAKVPRIKDLRVIAYA